MPVRFDYFPAGTADGDFVGPISERDTYTETYVLLGRIAEAVLDTAKVRVRYIERDSTGAVRDVREYEGIARHVVSAEHDGIARLPWKPTDRLRITTGFEWFLPLRDIVELEVL